MNRRVLCVFCLLLAAALPALANIARSENFSGGPGGWSILGGGIGPVHLGSGGQSGAHITIEDSAGGRVYFLAPFAWTGNYLGGTLSFYLRNDNENRLPGSWETLLMVQSGATSIYYRNSPGVGAPNVVDPGWILNQVDLAYGPNWFTRPSPEVQIAASQATVEAVLGNISQIAINADWVSRYAGHPLGDYGADITGLDTVALNPAVFADFSDFELPATSTPEPSTWALGALGLLALASRRFRPSVG